MLGSFVTLPVLVAQWVGVVGLRHAGKTGAWWSMAAGVACGTLGIVVSFCGMFLISTFTGGGGGFGGGGNLILMAGATLPALGQVLFGIGFAIHGLRAARAASRMQELEQLTAAMSEEMSEMRRGGPAV